MRLLPRRNSVYNGVDTRGARLFDSAIPWRKRHKPNYESGIIKSLDAHTSQGDTVVVVGGGWGVTAVRAAELVGKTGHIYVYEGAKEAVERVYETLTLNNITNVEVTHAVVGTAKQLRGKQADAAHLEPVELPECDVLELDCEGAELEILRKLTSRPESIIVETHGLHDASTEQVASILDKRGYEVVSSVIADERNREFCVEHDIQVLTAVARDDSSDELI